MQDSIVLTMYLAKLNDAQKEYLIIDKELLAINEYLQAFSNMIKGGNIFVQIDHMSLT